MSAWKPINKSKNASNGRELVDNIYYISVPPCLSRGEFISVLERPPGLLSRSPGGWSVLNTYSFRQNLRIFVYIRTNVDILL
jgi:hypothetical protein